MKLKNKDKLKLNNNKIYNFLIICFGFLFIFTPISLILISTKNFTALTIAIVLTLVLVDWKNKKVLNNKKTIYFIILITLLIKIIYVLLIDNNIIQVSDFEIVFNNAKTMDFKKSLNYYQFFYHWFYYSFLNGLIYKIFGAKQIVTLVINAIVTTAIPFILYKICQKIFKNNIIGNMAALIYLCWPSMLLYIAIMSPEHFSLLFMCLSIYCIISIIDRGGYFNLKKDWYYIVLTGLFVSLIGFFKNFSPIVIIAFLIVLILMVIIKEFTLKNLIITISGTFVIYLLINSIMFGIMENYLGIKVMKNQLVQYIYVGLGYKPIKTNDGNRYLEYQNYLKAHNMNYKLTNKEFLKRIGNEIKDDPLAYPNLLLNKSIISFGSDDAYIYWLVRSIDDKEYNDDLKDFLQNVISPINERFYIIVMITLLLGLVINVFGKKNNSILFISIVIYGSYLLFLLCESQGRYKYTIEPLFCILAAYGLYYGYEFILNIVNNRNMIELKQKKEVKK